MAITVDPNLGVVTIRDGIASDGSTVTGTENRLLQLAIDRAAANTARVSLLQTQLRQQTDNIGFLNSALTKLLNNPPANPANNGGVISNVTFTQNELNALAASDGNLLSTFLASTPSANGTVTLKSDKSYNDFVTGVKSALNQATSQNQQAVINYQSLINQRNQMVEWTANLINLLLTAATQTTANLR